MATNPNPDIDFNYLSVSNNIWQLYAGSINAQSTNPILGGNVLPDNPKQYAGILKLSDNSNVSLSNLNVFQGKESAVDCNNHVVAIINGYIGTSNESGEQIISIKGGCNITLDNVIFRGAGSRFKADILIDNWSDQSYDGSHVNLVNCSHESGRKLNVVYRFGTSKITFDNDNVKILYVRSMMLTGYWWLKFIVRKVMKIKVGETGPSLLA